MQSLTVQEYMVIEPHPLTADMNVAQAVDLLLERQLSGAPIVENGNLVGFLSEKDCIRHLTNTNYFQGGAPSVKDIMTTEVITVTPDTGILELAEMMWEHTPKIYPVCDGQKLAGYIERGNVLRALQENSNVRDYDEE